MGTLKNAVKRKTHKERAQVSGRQRYGLLEKKKDYLQRAKDFHRKEKTLQGLQQKAEERNPDEFYFAMQNMRTRGGVHDASEQANKYSQQELHLMRDQDAKYVALQAQMEAKKVERLRADLHFLGAAKQSRHTVFVDDDEQAGAFSPEDYFNTPAELLDRHFNRPRAEQVAAAAVTAGRQGKAAKRVSRQQAAAYKTLQQRMERQQKLQSMAEDMALQKAVMGKGSKRRLRPAETNGSSSKPVYKWRRERCK